MRGDTERRQPSISLGERPGKFFPHNPQKEQSGNTSVLDF